MKVEFQIQELVIEPPALADRDAHALARSFRDELASVVRDPVVELPRARTAGFVRVGCDLAPDQGKGSGPAGRRLAQAVLGGILG